MFTHLRICRPVSSLERSVNMYSSGLNLSELSRFENHEGFDGVMMGKPELPYHFEFTYCRSHPVKPRPTAEDMIVLYVPDVTNWHYSCSAMRSAGFSEVLPFNPYWQQRGRTFEDHDGYRLVLQQADWPTRAS